MAIQKPFVVVPHPLGTVTSANQRTNRPASHLGLFKEPGMIWETNGTSSITVLCDLGSAKEIDFIALIGTNAASGSTARIRLGDTQAEVEGVSADYDSGDQVIRTPALTREDGVYHWHWEIPSLFTKRWAFITIGHTGSDFKAMALVMGKRVQFADFYNQTGFGFGMEDMAESSMGRYGVMEELDGIKLRTLSMEFGWMSESDRATKFQPLRDKLGSSGYALWCFDPEATDQRQDKTYFGRLLKPVAFKPSTFLQNRWQSQWEIVSII